MCLMYVVYWKTRAYSKNNSFIYKSSPFIVFFLDVNFIKEHCIVLFKNIIHKKSYVLLSYIINLVFSHKDK